MKPEIEYDERERTIEDINLTSDTDSLKIVILYTQLSVGHAAYSLWARRWSKQPLLYFGRCRAGYWKSVDLPILVRGHGEKKMADLFFICTFFLTMF